MEHLKYAKRIAVYSIVAGALSFFGNFANGPSDLEGFAFISVFLLTLSLVVFGFIITSRIKKNKNTLKIPLIVLLSIWGLIALTGVTTIFVDFTLFFIILALVFYPVYSGIKYFYLIKPKEIPIEVENEFSQNNTSE